MQLVIAVIKAISLVNCLIHKLTKQTYSIFICMDVMSSGFSAICLRYNRSNHYNAKQHLNPWKHYTPKCPKAWQTLIILMWYKIFAFTTCKSLNLIFFQQFYGIFSVEDFQWDGRVFIGVISIWMTNVNMLNMPASRFIYCRFPHISI